MNRWAVGVASGVLRRLDPESAHRLAVQLLRYAPLGMNGEDPLVLASEGLGLRFPNPIGLAAGFDKDGQLGGRTAGLGFSFVEVGTVTPKAQPGNPRPRVFRLDSDRAVINRYGFNSVGHAAVHARLHGQGHGPAIVGVNLGANKDSTDRTADYVAGIRRFADVADYLTLNVSSPNTPGLRDLQAARTLDDLLARCLTTRDEMAERHGSLPLLLKIAPDLDLVALDAIVAVARRRGIDGMILSNTTITRPQGLSDPARTETGGMSGRPLFRLSTRLLAETYLRVDGAFPLIGAGGVEDVETAWAKLRAGASLIQLYTGLIYAGPGLVDDIKQGLAARLEAQDSMLQDIIGVDARTWADGPQQ